MSEKVISRKVVGSANPIASKFRDIKSAFAGIGGGFIMVIIGFVLIFTSVRSVKENSKIVANVPLQEASEISSSHTGTVKIKGTPNVTNQEILTYYNCEDFWCEYADEENPMELNNALYAEVSYERYEVVEEVRTETRTVIEGGQEIEETVEITEYNEKWVTKKEDSFWSEFKLGEIEIDGNNAKQVLNEEEEIIANVFIAGLGDVETYGQDISDKIGETRLVINYVPNDKNLIVIGDVYNSKIEAGETFIISDQSPDQLVQTLETEESTMRLVMRFGAWLMLTLGFSAIIAPIFEFVEMIPLFGKMAKAAAGFVGAVIAAIIVVAGVLIVKFWWLCLGGLVLLIGIGVAVVVMAMSKNKDEKTE